MSSAQFETHKNTNASLSARPWLCHPFSTHVLCEAAGSRMVAARGRTAPFVSPARCACYSSCQPNALRAAALRRGPSSSSRPTRTNTTPRSSVLCAARSNPPAPARAWQEGHRLHPQSCGRALLVRAQRQCTLKPRPNPTTRTSPGVNGSSVHLSSLGLIG